MSKNLIAAVAIILLASTFANAGDCKKTGVICVDSTPSKNISGVTVTLADVGGCWEYEDTYTCLKPNAINYCQPLINAQPQCWQTNIQCSKTDTLLGSGCMTYTQTWRCGDPNKPTPSGTIRLTDSYTLVPGDYDPGPCQSANDNNNCYIAESKCVLTTPPPGMPATPVPADGCYQKQNTYVCLTGHIDNSDCDGYASNPNCTLQSSTCKDTVGGQCVNEGRTYRCMSKPPRTGEVEDCSARMMCVDGQCFDTGYENDNDFVRTIVGMEAAREAGTYMDPNSLRIFSGVAEGCRTGWFGIKNCCKKTSGAATNNSVMGNLGFSAVSAAGQSALNAGSKYMYDFMYPNGMSWQQSGFGAMLGSNPNTLFEPTSFTPSIGLYGLTATTGILETGMMGGPIYGLGSNGGFNFYFDPYSFAIAIALQVIQELMSCEPEEQMLGMHRDALLCHDVGEYCSKSFPVIGCVEKKHSYCCFNSKLARIINEQGRPQIGRGWGGAESPDCSGFTPDQLTQLDFSRMDLSEFYSDVMATVQLPDGTGMSDTAQTAIQSKVQQFYSH